MVLSQSSPCNTETLLWFDVEATTPTCVGFCMLVLTVAFAHCASQVVYSGPVCSAADHFSGLGHSPANASINIADYMLDTVIRSSGEEVGRLVEAFAGCR